MNNKRKRCFPKHMFLGLLFYIVRWPGGRHAGIDGSRGVPAPRNTVVIIPPPSGENGVWATRRAAHFSRYNFLWPRGRPILVGITVLGPRAARYNLSGKLSKVEKQRNTKNTTIFKNKTRNQNHDHGLIINYLMRKV